MVDSKRFKQLPHYALLVQMDSPPVDSPATSSDLLVDIVETLEASGLENDTYQLHDYVDVDALDQLVNTSQADVEVQFTVEDVQLAVTPDNVDVLIDEREESEPQ
nr:HalOD1 output domain-containing protein [Haloferax sp. ATB1]